MSEGAPTPPNEPSGPKRRRSWQAKFADAFRGIKLGVRGHSSFFVHFFMAVAVIAAASTLSFALWQWCILIACITAVFAAELFNSAIEILCRIQQIERLPHGRDPLDIAAGAVLTVSLGAALIGSMLFAARIWDLVG
jgi:diacylglycerol kinase